MFKKLKAQSIKKTIFFLVASIAIFIGGMFVFDGKDVFKLLTPPPAVDLVNIEDQVGKYVSINVNYVDGTYVRTTTDGKTTSYGYVVSEIYDDDKDVHVIGLEVPIREDEAFEEWILYGEEEFYTVSGTVVHMTTGSQDYRYFFQTLEEEGYYDGVGKPYYIQMSRIGSNSKGTVIIIAAACLILLLIGLIRPVRAFAGNYQANVKKYISATANPDETLRNMESWFPGTEYSSAYIGPDLILYFNGPKTSVQPLQDVVWAYQTTVRQRNAVTYNLTLGLLSGKLLSITLKEAEIGSILAQFAKDHPGILVGHTKEDAAIFKQNPRALRERALAEFQMKTGAAMPVPGPAGAAPAPGVAAPAAAPVVGGMPPSAPAAEQPAAAPAAPQQPSPAPAAGQDATPENTAPPEAPQ